MAYLRSLRFRIAGAFLLVSLAIQLLLAITIPQAREAYVLAVLDERLEKRVREIGWALSSSSGPLVPQKIGREVTRDDLLAGNPATRAVGRDGRILIDELGMLAPGAWPDAVRDQPPRTTTSGPAIPAAIGVSAPVRLRLVSQSMSRINGEPFLVQAVACMARVDEVSRTLRVQLYTALAFGAAASALAGWLVAGAISRRLDRVTASIRAVAPGNLEGRLELPVGSDEVNRLAMEINRLLDRLETAFKSQERFLADVSHELKTPVATLLAEAQVIKQAGANADVSSFVEGVEAEMRALARLLEALLMLARFGHGTRYLAERIVDMNELALHAAENAQQHAAARHVTIDLQLADPERSPPLVRGDQELLASVVENLLRHSLKHSSPGGKIQLLIATTPDAVSLAVTDRGPELSAHFLDLVYDRMHPGQPPPTGPRSFGVSLTLTKGIVSIHGATLDARNREGGGAELRVTLARWRDQSPAGGRPPADAPAGHGRALPQDRPNAPA